MQYSLNVTKYENLRSAGLFPGFGNISLRNGGEPCREHEKRIGEGGGDYKVVPKGATMHAVPAPN